MTTRELIERIERESLHPTTMDLPLILVQRVRRRGFPEREYEFYVERIDISSGGVVITIDPNGTGA